MGNSLHSKTGMAVYTDINGRQRSVKILEIPDRSIEEKGYSEYRLNEGVGIFISRTSERVIFADI